MEDNLKMKDDLILFLSQIKDNLNNFFKWKTTSIYFVIGRQPQVFQLKEDIIFFGNENEVNFNIFVNRRWDDLFENGN